MRRLRTCNARRRAAARRTLSATVLQEWEAYVEKFDDHRVHLVMADITNAGGEELGDFPRRLFRHLRLAPGLVLRVRVSARHGISIESVPRDPAKVGQTDELISLLRELRERAGAD